jgi:sigma-E factor negative regulatory protein RseA
MNDATTHEQLSALLDGELPRDELRFLLRRLDGDSELARRWSRLQIASAVLRREYAAHGLKADFATAILQRLDGEMAPAARQPFGLRVLRWAAGGAIAASVAVVALLATRPAGNEAGNPAAAAPMVAAAAPAPAAASAPVGELRQPLLPQILPLPDYAQRASFESIMPNYASRPAPATAVGDGSTSYVLLLGPRQSLPQQASPRQDAPAQQ